MANKKKKNKDFQKIKLKVGKTLPKGDNVTDTSFKAKKIIVSQHLKTTAADSVEPLTSRKLAANELLSRLHHYNVSARMDALRGLKELLDDHPEVIIKHLSQLIEKVPLLATDIDENIRKITLSVVKVIFSKVNSDKLVPMYSVLAAQLSCAMSHLNPYIQFDSLFFLDVLLEFCPDIIDTSSDLLLPNFINLISQNCSSKNKKSRFLSIDPSINLMSNNWRKHVLLRLNKVLQILVRSEDHVAVSVDKVDWKSRDHCLIYTFSQPKALPRFSLKEMVKQSKSQDSAKSYGMVEFLSDVFPLLYESWIEVGTQQRNHLKSSELLTLEIILEIFLCLVKYMKSTSAANVKDVINNKLNSKCFVEVFFKAFPYVDQDHSSMVKSKRKRKRDGSRGVTFNTSSCNKINLMICQVMLSVAAEYMTHGVIEKLMSELLKDVRSVSQEEIELIISVVDYLLSIPDQQPDDALLVSMCTMLQTVECSSRTYSYIVSFFKKLFDSSRLVSLQFLQKTVIDYVVNDVNSRNSKLNEEILMAYVGLFCCALKHQTLEAQAITSCLTKLISLMHHGICPENLLKVTYLFYWCDFDQELLRHIINLKIERKLPKEFLCSFVQLLTIRHSKRTLPVPDSCYFEFMSALC